MKHTRSIVFYLITIAAAVLLILLLSACHLNFLESVTADATEPPEATTSPVVEEISYAPGIGSLVPWFDQSYVVYVPGGEFIMGEDETTPSDYAPAHTVTLDPFWIHQAEVTNRMYAACVGAGVCEVPFRNTGLPYWYSSPDHTLDPVVGVSWEQAAVYCEWIEGRLPTEAEWEKAARGTEGEPYPWGEEEPACNLLNYSECHEVDQPVRVRSFFEGASPFLLADMAGNVSEWVLDWYEDDYYASSPESNPTGPVSGTRRVVRGSNYDSLLEDLGIYLRDSALPNDHQADIGFRCVLSGETVGNPPPPICEAIPYIPIPIEDRPMDFYPPEFVPSSFCMPDPTTGDSMGYVTLVFSEPVSCGCTYTSTAGWLAISSPDEYTVGLSGPGVPIDTPFEITVCTEPPVLTLEEAVCPADYYYNEDTGTCRYGTPEMHDTPGTCDPLLEVWVPGYGCLHGVDESSGWGILCPGGFDIYEHYESLDPPGMYTLCVPVDGPEECLTDPLCSASNECPEGYSYITEVDCCELPPDVTPYCPPGYTLKTSELMTCEPPELTPLCTTLTFYIPNCDEPPPSLCVNPESYLTPDTCEAAHCRWVLGFPGAPNGVCTYP